MSCVVGAPALLDFVVVTLGGDLDLLTCPAAGRGLREGLERDGCQVLVVDLSRVTFLGAAALTILLELRSLAVARQVELRLVASTKQVLRPLEVTGLSIEFTIYDCLAGATEKPAGRAHFPPVPTTWRSKVSAESTDGR